MCVLLSIVFPISYRQLMHNKWFSKEKRESGREGEWMEVNGKKRGKEESMYMHNERRRIPG